MKAQDSKIQAHPETKRPWVRPTLTAAGTVGRVLEGGGGKLSAAGGDPGDSRKANGSA